MKTVSILLLGLLCGCQVDITPAPTAPRKTVLKSPRPAVKSVAKREAATVSVNLAWTANSESNLGGYKLHYGTAPGVYYTDVDVGNVTATTVQNLQSGTRYYFALSAYNSEYFESPLSEEIEWISGAPDPTPSPTPTPSITPTPTPTPTVTATPSPTEPPGTLVNLSTRSFVQSNSNVLIAGFIIKDGLVTVLIRAIGPSLAAFVPVTLANPFLELRNSTGGLIDENDDWRDDQEAAIAATGAAPGNDKEAALIRSLPPGSYTAIVRGVNSGTGVALVEVYAIE